ncbi:hypothetical protein ZWY2020_044154 [Hordeum vulgare]|nr:hypothetical protein ZWY2020_044154 [Hordeum vulgare]
MPRLGGGESSWGTAGDRDRAAVPFGQALDMESKATLLLPTSSGSCNPQPLLTLGSWRRPLSMAPALPVSTLS